MLRRLLGRGRGAAKAPAPAPASPEPDAGERIDAAQQRLKASIPPPEEPASPGTTDAVGDGSEDPAP
ncbi:MAG TPA: hypothetical protein VMP89_08510 [Solirubrobacteraceae bacterium]|nr:hypothetical protein [Solirubrobacteraceae bacterium]